MANGTDSATDMTGKWIQITKEGAGVYAASITDESGNQWGYRIGASRELAAARITATRAKIGWASPTEIRDESAR